MDAEAIAPYIKIMKTDLQHAEKLPSSYVNHWETYSSYAYCSTSNVLKMPWILREGHWENAYERL